MKPIVDGLEAEYAGRMEVERLDIDDPSTAEAKVTYKYRVQPFLVLVDGEGSAVTSWQGYQDPATLGEALDSLLAQ